ncbi:hypothetical protein HDU77_007030 [Chytriomyces hyalinus]|nr:hypothetical protein HDU77_007030 [Chytriomyces hyalinus]
MEPHSTPPPVVKTTESTTIGENGEIITETTTTETRQVVTSRAVDVVVEEDIVEVEPDTVTEEAELNVHALARDIASNAGFVALDLSGAQLTTEDIAEISEALQVNNTLESLKLDDNDINDTGLAAIAAMLTVNETLEELTLGEQLIQHSVESERNLAASIHLNLTIRVFTFEWKDDSCKATAEAALARNEAAYIASRKRKVVKTINVEEIQEITTVRKDKRITDDDDDVQEEQQQQRQYGALVEESSSSSNVLAASAAIAVASVASVAAVNTVSDGGVGADSAVGYGSVTLGQSESLLVVDATATAETDTGSEYVLVEGGKTQETVVATEVATVAETKVEESTYAQTSSATVAVVEVESTQVEVVESAQTTQAIALETSSTVQEVEVTTTITESTESTVTSSETGISTGAAYAAAAVAATTVGVAVSSHSSTEVKVSETDASVEAPVAVETVILADTAAVSESVALGESEAYVTAESVANTVSVDASSIHTETVSVTKVVSEKTEAHSTESKSEAVLYETIIVTETKKYDSNILFIVIASVLLLLIAIIVGFLMTPAAVVVVEEVVVVGAEAAGLILLVGAYSFNTIIVRADPDVNLPSAVLPRVVDLLTATSSNTSVKLVQSSTELDAALQSVTNLNQTLVMCIGANDCTRSLISEDVVGNLGSESFHVVSRKNESTPFVVAVDGVNAFDDGTHQESSMRIQKDWKHGNRGLAYGVYAALEELGFAFMHPLAPSIPPTISVNAVNVSIAEAPRWKKFRAIHYHTQHPLELTPFLQGFGPGGVDDEEGWASQIPEFASFCEWLVANRQNGVEWPLLEGHTWDAFARTDVRMERFKKMVDIGHSYGIMVGVDVPIAFAQQHSFRLLKHGSGEEGHFEEEKKEIEESLDWVMRAGFDFLGTESGTSEFTHSSPDTMLRWMDVAADYAAEKYNVTMFIKVHCSAGQTAHGFIDERTNSDINYNMLPHFASPNMGVLPHTVEPYALDDPAPTYGNKDFKYMREYLKWELENNQRPVVFYPETAYWVSVDIDVPLFLPLYFERRFHDLRLLAADEEASASKKRMDGQLIFASGWEWSYWLNDAMAARAAWNPFIEIEDEKEALKMLIQPLIRHLNVSDQMDAANLILEWTQTENDLLINGKLEGQAALDDIVRKNGHGYLEGWDTWDDVSKVLGKLTQPDRLGLVELKHAGTWFDHVEERLLKHLKYDEEAEYVKSVRPLLIEMNDKFANLSVRTAALAAKAPTYVSDLWDDIADASRMTSLRARQVMNLYEFVYQEKTTGRRNETLALQAMNALHTAQKIVNAREPRYRVPADRAASWTNLNAPHNPTAYAFNYLWTVRSLHYWWRDAAMALNDHHSTQSKSFANIIEPVEMGLGTGKVLNAADSLAGVLAALGVAEDYFDVEDKEPQYPRDIKHWKY